MIRSVCNVLILICSFGLGAAPRLDRLNLLEYRSDSGKVEAVKTPADWQKRRSEILKGMESVMGRFPSKDRRVKLEVDVEEEVDMGKYIRQLITYQSEPGSRTPAYLCVPKSVFDEKGGKAPAVLCLMPTDNKVGHKVVVGLGGREGRAYAIELAERGYVTISPAYTHLANYWPNLGKLGYVSGTMKAIYDNTRALDLLERLPYVDSERGFGSIGHSLGGHNTIYTAVFDQRIAVMASSCGFDAYPDYYGGAEKNWFFGRGWCQIRYMPRLSDYRGRQKEIPYDFPELLGALAPRPFFVHAPLRDSNFRWKSVDVCAKAARPIYQLLGNEKGLIIEHPDYDHNFPRDMREGAYRTIDNVLKVKASE